MAKLWSDPHGTRKITHLYFKEFPCCVSRHLLPNKALVSLAVESIMQAKPRDATSSFSASHSITLTTATGRKSIHQQCLFMSHTPLNYWVELLSRGKYKILLPDAPKISSEHPSFSHPLWFQRTESHSMGHREKQTFVQIPGLHFFHEQAPISTRLQKKNHRIIECFGLEGTFTGHPAHPPDMSRDIFN